MDQLADTGSRAIMGVVAVNGLALRNMRVCNKIKHLLGGFEEAATRMEPAMKAVREKDITPYNEMEKGKLPETFSIFKVRVGPKGVKKTKNLRRRKKSLRKKSQRRRMETRQISMSLMRTLSSKRMKRMKKSLRRSLLSPSGLTL